MTLGRICCRDVDVAEPGEPVKAVAQRMSSRGVGTLVVLDPVRRPIGIVTDRDLAVRVVGPGKDPHTTPVESVMTTSVQTAFEEMPIEEAISLMRSQAARRLVVVDRSGTLLGIVSLDDILSLLAKEFTSVGDLLERESPRSLAASK